MIVPTFYIKTDDGFRPATDAEILAYALGVEDVADLPLVPAPPRNAAVSAQFPDRVFIHKLTFMSRVGGMIQLRRKETGDIIIQYCVPPGVPFEWGSTRYAGHLPIVAPHRGALEAVGPPDLAWSVRWEDNGGDFYEEHYPPSHHAAVTTVIVPAAPPTP